MIRYAAVHVRKTGPSDANLGRGFSRARHLEAVPARAAFLFRPMPFAGASEFTGVV